MLCGVIHLGKETSLVQKLLLMLQIILCLIDMIINNLEKCEFGF